MTNDLPNLQIAEEAADWAVRLDGGPLDDGERRMLAEWLRTSPVHVGELLQSCALLAGIAGVSRENTRSIESLLSEIAPEVIPLFGADPQAKALPKAEAQARRRLSSGGLVALAASLAALVALAMTVAVYRPDAVSGGGAQVAASYVTGIGEQRSIVLEDGSIVSMSADSAIRIAFSEAARDLHLLRGEALFSVAHDPALPFRVYASGSLVQAMGTEFVVKQRGRGIRVVVIEGKVLLASGLRPGQAARADRGGDGTVRFLGAGQEITLDPQTGFSAPTAADVARATSWRERELSFSNEPLALIVSEFNRYNRTKLEVQGLQLAAARFSGVFDADDPASFVSFLEHSAQVKVDRRQGGKVILKAAD